MNNASENSTALVVIGAPTCAPITRSRDHKALVPRFGRNVDLYARVTAAYRNAERLDERRVPPGFRKDLTA